MATPNVKLRCMCVKVTAGGCLPGHPSEVKPILIDLLAPQSGFFSLRLFKNRINNLVPGEEMPHATAVELISKRVEEGVEDGVGLRNNWQHLWEEKHSFIYHQINPSEQRRLDSFLCISIKSEFHMFCFSFWDNTFEINYITDQHITWCNRNPKINVNIPYDYPEVFKSNEIDKETNIYHS